MVRREARGERKVDNDWIRGALRWLSPAGRLGRSGFIGRALLLGLVAYAAIAAADRALGETAGSIVLLPFAWAAICLAVRRLHDSGRSGWWLLVFFIPVLGVLWLAWQLLLRRGSEGANPHGADPSQRAADYLVVT